MCLKIFLTNYYSGEAADTTDELLLAIDLLWSCDEFWLMKDLFLDWFSWL